MNTPNCAKSESPADPFCDPVKLAAVGRWVCSQLDANPAAERVDTPDADMFLVHGFLSRKDCHALRRIVNQKAVPSTLYKGTENKSFRTSFTHHFDVDDPLTRSLETYISDILGIDDLHSEPMQGQRYQVGQQFRHHHDFFHIGESYWQNEAKHGGQRTWTAMVCLHEAKKGGQTDFPDLGLEFKLPAGSLLTWNNMTSDGQPNMKTLHAGMAVESGIKHVITKWYRQEPWRLLNNFG